VQIQQLEDQEGGAARTDQPNSEHMFIKSAGPYEGAARETDLATSKLAIHLAHVEVAYKG
jgi:hypothetical protein